MMSLVADGDDILRSRLAKLNQVGRAELEHFTISAAIVDGVLRLELHGHPRMVHTQGLMTAIQDVLAAMPEGTRQVDVDLGACTGLDSSTGGLLLLLGKDLGEGGATLHLLRSSERLRRVFGILGIDRIPGIHIPG